MDDLNRVMLEAWNTVLFDKFVRFRHLIVDGLARHSDVALERSGYSAGQRVLDAGCGFGDTTLQIARIVGPTGIAVGMDCAERFVAEARASMQAARAENARFAVGDMQTADLGGPYDHAFSRFGTMFFSMPGAAMRNIRQALGPGGMLTQIVWRRREDNPWLYEAEMRVREIVPVVSHDDTEQVHCGPGPFSMADADVVSSMMQSAGYHRIAFERHDCEICIGRDMDDAIDFAMALGPAGEIIRLAGEEGDRLKPEVVKALRQALRRFETPIGVWAPSSTWFVTARNPD